MRHGTVKASNKVSYSVDRGETLAIVGESGSGKTVSAQAIMGIIDSPPGFVTGGQILYRGMDMLRMAERERRDIRGAKIAMIFQDALTALNPVFTVGWQIGEMFRQHREASKAEATRKAIELMERVRIPSARERVHSYPHEFSGGMRQRVMIAMSLALDPEVLIADEPTTALDVTVQAQVMELLADLQRETGMGLILITHDVGVVAEVADRVSVMYAGRIVESADIGELFSRPGHPYTRGLMDSLARPDLKGGRLSPIVGSPPDLLAIPSGCAFHPRCRFAKEVCSVDDPALRPIGPGRTSACHFSEEVLSVV
jgi:oligopeptide transport system ATP-binding protein